MREIEIGQEVRLGYRSNPFLDHLPHYVRGIKKGTPIVGRLTPEDVQVILQLGRRILAPVLGDEEKVRAAMPNDTHDFMDFYKNFIADLVSNSLGELTDCQRIEFEGGLNTLRDRLNNDQPDLDKYEKSRAIISPKEVEGSAVEICPFKGFAIKWDRVARKVRGERGLTLDKAT